MCVFHFSGTCETADAECAVDFEDENMAKTIDTLQKLNDELVCNVPFYVCERVNKCLNV